MSDLTEDLLTLGREWSVETPDDLAERVLAEITGRDPRAARRRRWVAAILAALAALGIAAAVSSPVRAAVVRVFTFGGVEVHRGAGPTPAASPSLPGQHPTTLAAASAQAGFRVRVPAALGTPDQITISDANVVSLRYQRPTGPVQIDEFAGDSRMMFEKFIAMGSAQRVLVNGTDAYWFDDPTVSIYVGPDGAADPDTTRALDGSLLWISDGVTFRLDGIRPSATAIAVASSMS
jgi:hypothetical protein